MLCTLTIIRRVTNLLFCSELSHQSLNGALPLWKCSIKAPAKWKTSVYVLREICLQWSKWLGPYTYICTLIFACSPIFHWKLPQMPFVILEGRPSSEYEFLLLYHTWSPLRNKIFHFQVAQNVSNHWNSNCWLILEAHRKSKKIFDFARGFWLDLKYIWKLIDFSDELYQNYLLICRY